MLGADDVLRYAFGQGPGREFAAGLGPPDRPLTSSFGALPPDVATDALSRLVWGSVDLFEDALYPHPCPDLDLTDLERLQHALVMAFGLQRREPSNMFNDHRACASVRSRFPVHAFVQSEDQAWLLDVYRHGLLPVGDAGPQPPADRPLEVALAGRYTHLPSLYGRLRGPLVELELGISLRSLWVALEVLGLGGELELPGPAAGCAMARLGLDPPTEWTAPLTVAIRPQATPRAAAPIGPPGPARRRGPQDDPGDDPTLVEVVAVNRTSLDVAVIHGAETCRGGAQAVPDGLRGGGRRPWSEVLWQRSAGHMPRLLAGFSGRRRPMAAEAVADAVAWLEAPPPTPLLRAIRDRITVSACLQDVAGYETGWYRLCPSAGPGPQGPWAGPGPQGPWAGPGPQGPSAGPTAGGGRLALRHADPTLPARLEACYGHGLGPNVGCALRHAGMTWMLSTDLRALVEEWGPGAWTLAQYVCGWMAHGLSLSAAAHGLYARPSRAFDDILLHPVVGLAQGEMVLLSVVSGAGRYLEPVLDLRT